MTRLCFRQIIAALLLTLFGSEIANALPRASNVPGGVALIRLGAISHNESPPRAWLGEQQIFVAPENGQWIAVVGLALDLSPGSHELRVSVGDEQKILRFEVGNKRYPEQRITLKDSSRVQLSPADEERAVREIETIQRLKRHWREVNDNADDSNTTFIFPAAGRLASRFGLRRFFNGEPRAPHSGLDVAVAGGTPIKASAHGKVLATDDYFFNGKTVFIDHGNGLISMYCHLDRIDVQAGDSVDKGQPIGRSGMTGRASGPHLHWSVVLNGVMVDPELFVTATRKTR